MSASRVQARYVHETNVSPQINRQLWDFGQAQAKLSIERYHYLCATIQQAYSITDVPADISKGQMFPRKGLVFKAYTAYPLDPVLGVKLHPRSDGTIHPGDIEVYVRQFRSNWKCREAGIMYCIDEAREFWNMVLNYHSGAHTTGIKSWDRLFGRLKKNGFDKGLVPCMFFAREAGCVDSACPFLHDEAKCRKDRERVLDDRRRKLGKPTSRDISLRQIREMNAVRASQPMAVVRAPKNILTGSDSDDLDEDPEVTRIFEESRNISKVCANPDCLTVKMKKEKSTEVTMKTCSRCKTAYYCSTECQNADWKRHKKEPCLPFEEIVENDDFWNMFGERKGTGDVRFKFSEDM